MRYFVLKKRLRLIYLAMVYLVFTLIVQLPRNAHAQSQIIWDIPVNLSQSIDKVSINPYILADPAGTAHLFWAELVSEGIETSPDTLIYAYWDGQSWHKPVDIYFTSDFIPIKYPTAVIDNAGTIHLIWMMLSNDPNYSLYYSHVNSLQAENPDSWAEPVILADDLTGSETGIHMTYEDSGKIHIVYARGERGDSPSAPRGISYIQSIDNGKTWAKSKSLYTIPNLERGASNLRIITDDSQNLYVNWTEWDLSGNGQAIYFTHSQDNGTSWEDPIVLTEKIGNEYERDWANLALLGENEIMVMWEGGWRAYRQAMYSYDGGETWSEPIDTFPYLIGETGFAQFVRDSLDRLHVLVINRIREGNVNRGDHRGLWHSEWEGGTRWRDPQPAGPTAGMLYPTAVIVGGNKLIVSWATAIDGDIMAMIGLITDAPEIPNRVWTKPTPDRMHVTDTPPRATPTPINASNLPQTTYTFEELTPPDGAIKSPSIDLYAGVFSSLILIGIIVVLHQRKQR